MIELKNITFSYEGREQGGLRNINLTVKNGECILLCGRSGCGKTTITRLVNGLIPRFYAGELTGQVLIDGKDIADLTMYKIAEKVGSVFQNPRTQFFNTDSDSEIAFGLENQGMPTEELRQRVETTAADLEIQSLRNRSLHALSGGEKQKVAFASVYAMNPDIYLLDEPSSNLDVDAIQDLRKHLKLVKQQGKTILIADSPLLFDGCCGSHCLHGAWANSPGFTRQSNSELLKKTSGSAWDSGLWISMKYIRNSQGQARQRTKS